VYEIITVQRDFGNRSDRKLSRLKYTIDKLGINQYRTEVEKRTGFSFEPAREFNLNREKTAMAGSGIMKENGFIHCL
jgi:sulfite reductase (NADPH) hemoprotein beta-component